MTAPPRRASPRTLALIDLGRRRDGPVPGRRCSGLLRFGRDDRHVSADPRRLPLDILLVVGADHPDELAAAGELVVDRDSYAGRVGFVLGRQRRRAARDDLVTRHTVNGWEAFRRAWFAGRRALRGNRSAGRGASSRGCPT